MLIDSKKEYIYENMCIKKNKMKYIMYIFFLKMNYFFNCLIYIIIKLFFGVCFKVLCLCVMMFREFVDILGIK